MICIRECVNFKCREFVQDLCRKFPNLFKNGENQLKPFEKISLKKPLKSQAHIRTLSKSDRLRAAQRHRDLKLCGVVLFDS